MNSLSLGVISSVLKVINNKPKIKPSKKQVQFVPVVEDQNKKNKKVEHKKPAVEKVVKEEIKEEPKIEEPKVNFPIDNLEKPE